MAEETDKLLQLKELQIRCSAQDDQKQILISGLFGHIDYLLQELAKTKRSLVDQTELSDGRHAKILEAKETINALVNEKERHVFSVVLIDGDCMPFKDELLKEGLQGGRQAASNLRQAVKELLETLPAGARLSSSQIVVRVYANLAGLAKAYQDLGILSDPTVLLDFVLGFNKVDSVCDFVDVGNGKECSDVKMKGMFQLSLGDMHCRQILFGGSADNGYARLLAPLAEDRAACGRVTLLKGPPFAAELAEIKDRFRVVSFDDVFRREKLPTVKRRVPSHITPPTTPSLDFAHIAAKPASPAPGNASSVHRPAAAAGAPSSSPSAAPSGRAAAVTPRAVVKRNRQGQRVDPPLGYSPHDFIWLRQRRLCHCFHLLGECYFQARYGNCQHEHGERISPSKQQALRAVARMSPCPRGLDCPDPKCISGHRCTKADCSNPAACRFSKEMHNVDTVIVA